MTDREYHYTISVGHQQGTPAGAVGWATREGTLTAHEGATRQDLFRFACDQVCEQAGLKGDQWWVVHFSVGPNDLGVSDG